MYAVVSGPNLNFDTKIVDEKIIFPMNDNAIILYLLKFILKM